MISNSFFFYPYSLFVPSGTMSNLICLLTHCRDRGSEALVGCESHILHYEQVGFLHSFKF